MALWRALIDSSLIIAWFSIALATVASLLPISNPLSTAALFLSITKGFSKTEKNNQAKMACIYMTVILTLFLIAGALIMKFFGISLPAVRVAGGLIVAKVGFSMMDPNTFKEVAESSRKEAIKMADVAFTPIAMPSLSGPGSIAVVIGMAPTVEHWWQHSAIVFGIVIVAFVAFLVLRASDKVIKVIGNTGLNAFTRIMGFILVCVGIQFIATGAQEFLVVLSKA